MHGAVSVAFQEPRLLPWRKVQDNIALALANGPERSRRNAHARNALEEVGLEEKADAWPLQLSGGQAQRASLARALVREPDLLLLDEPFSSLDALTRIEMHRLVTALWERHRPGVLLVTHDVDEALALADRVLVLEHGKVAAQWSVTVPRDERTDDPRIWSIRTEVLDALGVETGTSNEHDPKWSRMNTQNLLTTTDPQDRSRPGRPRPGRLGRLRECAAADNSDAVREDGSVDLSKVTHHRRRPEGWVEGAAAGIRCARRAAVQGEVEGVHVRAAAPGGTQRGLHRHRRCRQHSAAVRRRVRTAKIVVVAGDTMGAKGDTIVVPKDSKIKDAGDLEGKKVAVAKGSSANYNLLAQLDKAGADFDKVDVQYLQPADALAAFSAGHVDAWAIWDPYTAQAEVDENARVIVDGGGLVNGMVFQAANPDSLEDKATAAALKHYVATAG